MTDINAILADLQFHADPETGALSRAKYREVGTYSTDKIEALFGNFREARRQAGLDYTRGQTQVLNQIARHVSHDEYRQFQIDRKDYGEKFRRPDSKRFQTLLVCSDVHDVEHDPFWVRVFIDTVKRVQPDKVVLGGDIFDLAEFGRYNVDPREWDVTGRIKWVHGFLEQIREAASSAELVFIEGNHEARLLRHLSEATPALKTILSDLHGFTVPKLLGLDKYEVRYVARADLATFTQANLRHEIAKNYETFFDAFVVDHFPSGRNKGLSGCNGHHHKHEVWSAYSYQAGSYEWHQLGCGHRRSASYCDGSLWNMGFAEVNIDTQTKSTMINYYPVQDHAVVGGKWYVREPDEN